MFLETDDELRPLPNAVSRAGLAFGRNVLRRATIIREDLECAGAQGFISLIAALIASGDYTREELLDEGERLCGPEDFHAFETLLEALEGCDPRCDVWTMEEGGIYRLTSQP